MRSEPLHVDNSSPQSDSHMWDAFVAAAAVSSGVSFECILKSSGGRTHPRGAVCSLHQLNQNVCVEVTVLGVTLHVSHIALHRPHVPVKVKCSQSCMGRLAQRGKVWNKQSCFVSIISTYFFWRSSKLIPR